MYSNISSKSVLLLIVFGSAVSVQFQWASLQLEGACPNVTYITNLDLPKVTGWYYRVRTNYNYNACYNNDAQTMFAAMYDTTAIDVAFCCRSAADPTVPVCGAEVGSGRVTGLPQPGEFTYQFLDEVYPNFVLDTDYDNFTIVYGCRPDANDATQRDEVTFVYSRTYALTSDLNSHVDDVLRQNNINPRSARHVSQGPTMPYLPHPTK